MKHFTSNTYTLKRDILNFNKKFTSSVCVPEKKFISDITYGMLASKSCLLSNVAHHLHEKTKKVNVIERLGKHLDAGVAVDVQRDYLNTIKKWVCEDPVIYVDDSDAVKPYGADFEDMGIVRDGSKSSSGKNVYEKGYHVTEACVMTKSNHPVSIFSKIHSSKEKSFVSTNAVTYEAIKQGADIFGKATFVMDRGYDSNKMFLKLDELNQDYVIRLTSNRKLMHNGKWTSATELANRRKGKIKMSIKCKDKKCDVYLSHVKTQITASRKNIYLVLVYGLGRKPMMLATDRSINSKDDVISVARLYFSRWRIEEYFRSKKQIFDFENFRVRKLSSINALNFYIGVCMAFLARITMKKDTVYLKEIVLQAADSIKENVSFLYYRVAQGIASVLANAREGVRLWFKPVRARCVQRFLCKDF